MLSKPISLFLVFVITACNLIFMLSPLLFIAVPFVKINGNFITIDSDIFLQINFVFWLAIFLAIFLMSFFLIIDFLFAFSMRSSLRNCERYEKNKDYDFLTDLFKQVQNKFDCKSVKLYIKNSSQINAFAVGSMGRGSIVLTKGIIEHYLVASPNPKTFLYCLRSIMAHEMSHLVNKDFLPSFVIMTNQRISNFLAKILQRIFDFFMYIAAFIPLIGRPASILLRIGNSILSSFLLFFNRYVVFAICEFIRRFVSRSIEYRCDNQAAKAFGGRYMANALEMLGKDGYFTLFSTHPSTRARVRRVNEVKIEDHVILPKFSDSLANGMSLIALFVLVIVSAKMAKIDLILREVLIHHESIYRKLSFLWQLVQKVY